MRGMEVAMTKCSATMMGLWRLIAALALTPVLTAAECGQTGRDDDTGDDDSTLAGDDDSTAGDDDSAGDDDTSGDDDSAGSSPDSDGDGDGWTENGGDCDDTDPNRGPSGRPNAAYDPSDNDPIQYFLEWGTCDGLDNDCDGLVPAEEVDDDADGFRDCEGDCHDANAAINPARPEIPGNGWDDDCEGTVDDGAFDGDGDGAAAVVGGNPFDCDDSDDTVFPGAPETATCGVDNDCDGLLPPQETDNDGDGLAECGGDCADDATSNFPGNTEVCDSNDNDCDSSIDEGFDDDGDGFTSCAGDCDDADATRFPGAAEACNALDDDCNGMVPADEQDPDGDGFAECAGDCSPSAATVYPGAPEGCNGQDNDCNGSPQPDEADADSDSFRICQGDCDDSEAGTYPGAPEQCDAQDNNCDGQVPTDEGDTDADGAENCADTDDDNDGFADVLDCAPEDATSYPGAAEIADDGIDQNCSGTDSVTCLQDLDADGFGSLVLMTSTDADCTDAGEATVNGDCDDADGAVNPDAPEQCNGLDDNCDGLILSQEYTDGDGDGFVPCAGDCDDNDGANYPGNTEVCDSNDNDCDSSIDEGFDVDGDGFTACAECDDTDPLAYPGAPERCNALDDNCDGSVPADEGDSDGDNVAACEGDCNDADADNFPGNPEICDGFDNDCVGGTPDVEVDEDNDAVATCEGDCDDGDADNFPSNPEACDGLDNDCDGLDDEGLIGSGENCPGSECAEILADQPGASDGLYWIDPDGGGSFPAVCEMTTDGGGWTVIDPSLSGEWEEFFSSWTEWVPGVAAGPTVDPSHTSWRGWLDGLADSETEFRRSPDCDQVVPATSPPVEEQEVYRMSGPTYGCYHITETAYVDGFAPPDWVYSENNCASGWYNMGPSLGLDGTTCVAVRDLPAAN